MSKESPKPAAASQTLDDAYQPTRMEALLLEIVEQNEEIIDLLKKIATPSEPSPEKLLELGLITMDEARRRLSSKPAKAKQ